MTKSKIINIKAGQRQQIKLIHFNQTDLFFNLGRAAKLELLTESVDLMVRKLSFVLQADSFVNFVFVNDLSKVTTGFRQYHFQADLLGKNSQLVVDLRHSSGGDLKVDYFFTVNSWGRGSLTQINSRRLLAGRGSSGFYAKVKINQSAKQAKAYLADKSLLLGKQAISVMEPNLEILNQQAKAYHSAAVSRLSRWEVDYLNSRGLKKPQVVGLLAKSFLRSPWLSLLKNI